ncbi:hypothetical protein CXB49_21640 [Chromobacterium sp. ATCC 53434]|uniref:hypothetical protein n=1 Tax=Chromobacterium TaxID=535 RepID=UPI000C785686|nr:hypothetical protein [Chromobacterium sp. ATCC 53434]AUH53206.1 hypothetical protein CXB49_21640 [Chromobacterium sp. ATCC 53434]
MTVPIRTSLRRSCREASGLAILSRLPAPRASHAVRRRRLPLARPSPPPSSAWRRLADWLARHFSRSGAIRMF